MIRIKIKKTGEVRTVTPNIAHGLIDSGEAVLYKESKTEKNKEMTAGRGKKYKTK